jgi:hypothetical protein
MACKQFIIGLRDGVVTGITYFQHVIYAWTPCDDGSYEAGWLLGWLAGVVSLAGVVVAVGRFLWAR